MKLEIGNPHAIEGYRIPNSETPDKVHYRPLPGERVTSFVFPEGIQATEAAAVVLETMPKHMDSDGIPAWIDTDSPALHAILSEHYRLDPKRKRPIGWGQGDNGPYPSLSNPNPVKKKES